MQVHTQPFSVLFASQFFLGDIELAEVISPENLGGRDALWVTDHETMVKLDKKSGEVKKELTLPSDLKTDLWKGRTTQQSCADKTAG